jgi:hypothetical protein
MNALRNLRRTGLLVFAALSLLVGGAADAASSRASWDLTGSWQGSQGDLMTLQQSGTTVRWAARSSDGKTWYHDFSGRIQGNTISGTFQDRPGYLVHQTGTVRMQIVNDCHFEFASSSVPFVSESWTKTGCPQAAFYSWSARGKTKLASGEVVAIVGGGRFGVDARSRIAGETWASGSLVVAVSNKAHPNRNDVWHLSVHGPGNYVESLGVTMVAEIMNTANTSLRHFCLRDPFGTLTIRLTSPTGKTSIALASVCGRNTAIVGAIVGITKTR